VTDHARLTTFWFSDVEGSTRLLTEEGDTAYRRLLREHGAAVRAAFAEHGGAEVGTAGDSFVATFASPAAAASAAETVQAAFEHD
jgi:class 3 adenylate cyclase